MLRGLKNFFRKKAMYLFLLVGFTFYTYLDRLNDVIKLRIEVPSLQKEYEKLIEDNRNMTFEIAQFQAPGKLLEYAKRPEFAHLKEPSNDEVIIIEEGEDA